MTRAKANQRNDILFCVKSGKTRGETFQMLSAVHGQQTLSKSQVNRWYSRFQSGDNCVKDRPRPGQPTKLTPGKLQQIRGELNADRRKSIKEMATTCNLSIGTIHKSLNCSKKSAKWIPHLLTAAEKLRRVNMARAAIQMLGRRG